MVTEYLIVQLKGESLAVVLLRDERREQVTHLLLEVELEDLLYHNGEVPLDSCYLLLNSVNFVRCLVDDDSLLFHLDQHSVLYEPFHGFHLQEHEQNKVRHSLLHANKRHQSITYIFEALVVVLADIV